MIRSIVLASVLVVCALFGVPAFARPADVVGCARVGNLARVIMESRQAGVPMHVVVSAVDDKPGDSPQRLQSNDLTRLIATEAFKEPRYVSVQSRKTAVEAFRIKIEMVCHS